MCIILTCEKYVRPDYDLIEDCFYSNPDGAGLMWVEDGRVQTSKGYVTPEGLFEAIEAAPIESRMVIHMRIATSGGVNVGTCHPFPICDDLDLLHEPDVECDAALAHNGVISWCPTDNKKGISDTVYFTSTVVAQLYNKHGMSKNLCRQIKRAAPNNRFAIMTKDGVVWRMGVGWETVRKGIQASNSTWRYGYILKSTPAHGRVTYGSTWYGDSWHYDNRHNGWSDSEWGRSEWSWSHRYEPEQPDYEDCREVFDLYCGDCEFKEHCMSNGPACESLDWAIDDYRNYNNSLQEA